jgi:GNAT superfamily N-acetyltransferase
MVGIDVPRGNTEQRVRMVRLEPGQTDTAMVGRVREFLQPRVINLYPGFATWFRSKVVPGFEHGTREIIVALEPDASNTIVGTTILRLDHDKTPKICSLYVDPDKRGRGVGTTLLTAALAICAERRAGEPIVITSPEESLDGPDGYGFRRLLASRGFNQVRVLDGRYRDGKKELVFLKDGG